MMEDEIYHQMDVYYCPFTQRLIRDYLQTQQFSNPPKPVMEERAMEGLTKFAFNNQQETLLTFDVAHVELELLSPLVPHLVWTARAPDMSIHSNIRPLQPNERYQDFLRMIEEDLSRRRVFTRKILTFEKKSQMIDGNEQMAWYCQNLQFIRTMSNSNVHLLNRTVYNFKRYVNNHLHKHVEFGEEIDDKSLSDLWQLAIKNCGPKWTVFKLNLKETMTNM